MTQTFGDCMTPDDYQRIHALFDRTMALPTRERRAFVDREVPPGDPMRSELVAMVDAGDDSAFLASACAAGILDQVRPLDADLPSQIGNYKILRRLGQGGMGVVLLALRNDDVFHKVVALKVIGDIDDSPEINLVQRFRQERQILAGLDHPNIARILDGGSTDDGRPFYVMEYVAGSPIDEYCKRMNTDVPTRVRMMAQVCDAVDYLHAHAIAHRDIKPQNIMVTLDGQVKLVDFGIAKVETVGGVLRSVSQGAEPTMIMTPGYASPEQIAGDASGKSGDIYSVAVVLYQLLTGRLPHACPDGRPDLTARLSGTPPEPPSKGPRPIASTPGDRKVSYPDLDHVVLTALQRDPLQRYRTVQLFGEDLRRCLDGRPIAARPSSVTYTLRKAIARHPVVATVAALALVVALAGAWMAVDARFTRVDLAAQEEELAEFVAMLAAKVDGWPTGTVPANERVADMRAANALMASDTIRTLSERAPSATRVKQLVSDLRGVLDRADEVSHDQLALRKEIALVFRKIGDFESSAPLEQLADKNGAARSYRRAAVIAASLREADSSWANRQISELSGLLDGLGAPLQKENAQVPAAPVAPAEPPVQPSITRDRAPAPVVAERPTAVAPNDRLNVDPAARADVEQRLRTTTQAAAQARRNVEALRNTLASRGQSIRSDVEGILTKVDALIEEARGRLEEDDLTNAEEYLRRASYQLNKVVQAVGG